MEPLIKRSAGYILHRFLFLERLSILCVFHKVQHLTAGYVTYMMA